MSWWFGGFLLVMCAALLFVLNGMKELYLKSITKRQHAELRLKEMEEALERALFHLENTVTQLYDQGHINTRTLVKFTQVISSCEQIRALAGTEPTRIDHTHIVEGPHKTWPFDSEGKVKP